jgi:PAS domain S-box-containing protein
MIFNQDRDLRFTWIINPSSELHGQTLLGLTDADYLDQKEEAEDLLRIKRSILETGNTVRSEISLHIQGKIYDFDMVLKPLFGANGQIIGITGAALDISHRKSMERDLRESSRRKDEFLAILGHELRNPLAAIRNATYLLQNSQQTETRRARLHEILERQSNHLSSLIDDLLDVSRIAKGKIDLKSTKINLVQVVQKVFEDFSEELQSSNLNYQYKLPNEPIYVFADPIRIAQIVSNFKCSQIHFESGFDSCLLAK